MKDMEDANNQGNGADIYTQRVKAGKRTYFFDVKSTRSNDYYLTITESKRKPKNDSDGFFYEKHKIFLYKEDFNKFAEALNETLDYIKAELLDGDYDREERQDHHDDMEISIPDTNLDEELDWD